MIYYFLQSVGFDWEPHAPTSKTINWAKKSKMDSLTGLAVVSGFDWSISVCLLVISHLLYFHIRESVKNISRKRTLEVEKLLRLYSTQIL
jgi:hypothetical protein